MDEWLSWDFLRQLTDAVISAPSVFHMIGLLLSRAWQLLLFKRILSIMYHGTQFIR